MPPTGNETMLTDMFGNLDLQQQHLLWQQIYLQQQQGQQVLPQQPAAAQEPNDQAAAPIQQQVLPQQQQPAQPPNNHIVAAPTEQQVVEMALKMQGKANELYAQYFHLLEVSADDGVVEEAMANYENYEAKMLKHLRTIRGKFPNNIVLNEILDRGNDKQTSRDDVSTQPSGSMSSKKDVQPSRPKDSDLPIFNLEGCRNQALRGQKNNKTLPVFFG